MKHIWQNSKFRQVLLFRLSSGNASIYQTFYYCDTLSLILCIVFLILMKGVNKEGGLTLPLSWSGW